MAGKTPEKPRGIYCPYCGLKQLRVLSTRARKRDAISRRRKCQECEAVLKTEERVVAVKPG